MGQMRQLKKRPCRICKKWFRPNSRLGDRQKTCGALECQRQWHIRTCTQWNLKNRAFAKESYLKDRLDQLAPGSKTSSPPLPPPSKSSPPWTSPLDYPRGVVQEVIGAQQLIIIDYIARLLIRRVQEVIVPQLPGLQKEFRPQPPGSILRGDSQGVAGECILYPDP